MSLGSEESLLSDIESLANSLGEKFEEIRLIHDLTSKLQLEDEPTDTCRELLEQLDVCVHCRTLVIQLDPDEDESCGGGVQGIGQAINLNDLDAVIAACWNHHDESEFAAHPDHSGKLALIVNHGTSPELAGRHVALLPIARGEIHLGRLIAIRDHDDGEFGTVEVDLMRSVLMVLSLHLMNQRQFHQMQLMLEGTVRSLASALDAKDTYTHGHSSRVADLAVQLAIRMGLDHRTADALQLAGMLHDIGKIGIDDSVLKKPGLLTDEEFDQIKQHPVLGYEILKDIRPFRHILPAVRHHHESWDGGGYPDGLVGDEIPRDAQILAVADAFDAMISDRPYRKGMPLAKVRDIFRNGRGQQWAADVVDVLLESEDLMLTYANQQADGVTSPIGCKKTHPPAVTNLGSGCHR